METSIPTIDESYRRYADLLLRHNSLLANQNDEDEETEAVEEEMTALWDGLNSDQRRSLAGLGSDLTWVRRHCQLAPRARRAEEVTPDDLRSLSESRDRGDWHGLLHHLRVCGAKITPLELASLRASAWAAIGFPDLAIVFRDLATELEPSRSIPSSSRMDLDCVESDAGGRGCAPI